MYLVVSFLKDKTIQMKKPVKQLKELLKNMMNLVKATHVHIVMIHKCFII